MVSGPIRFGETGSGKVYTFPAGITQYRTNLGEQVPRTSRLPGVSGGVHHDGVNAPVGAIGNVSFGFVLRAETRADMDDLRDAVYEMQWWGTQRLYYQPTDSGDSERFCWAYINNINMAQRKDLHTDLWQPVSVSFQVPDPHFYEVASFVFFGDGSEFGDGTTFGQGATLIAASGTSTSDTIAHGGNAVAVAEISIQPPATKSCENPIVQRLVDNLVVDEIGYVGVVGSESVLNFNPNLGLVTLDGVKVWDDIFYENIRFMRFEPGNNSIKILFNNVGDEADVRFWALDTFRQ